MYFRYVLDAMYTWWCMDDEDEEDEGMTGVE